MTTSRQSIDDEGRKRHLEALFADQPFLSPTMKARSMHDKLREMRSIETGCGNRPSSAAEPPDWLSPAISQAEPAFLRMDFDPTTESRISFAEAAALLRKPPQRSSAESAPESVRRFRSDILSVWVKEVRPRESEPRSSKDSPDHSG